MPDRNERLSVSAEEMARLVDGEGTAQERAEWMGRIAADKRLRDEYAELLRATREPPGTLPGFVLDRLVERFRGPAPGGSLLLTLRDGILRLVAGEGWDAPLPAYREAAPEGIPISLSREFGGLKVDIQLVRIKSGSVDLTVLVKDLLREGAPTLKATLMKDERVVGARFLQADQARFREIRPGDYSIYLSRAQEEIVKIDLKVAP